MSQPAAPPPGATPAPSGRHDDHDARGGIEWFRSGGRATGLFLIGLCAVLGVLAALNGAGPALLVAVLLLAELAYLAQLRPRIGLGEQDLIYRGMFSDLAIPLVQIESVRVTLFFEARIAGRRFVSPAIARTRRGDQAARRSEDRDLVGNYADLVEHLTWTRIVDLKGRRRLAEGPTDGLTQDPAPIRRTWVWIEIAAPVLTAMLLVLLLVF